MSKNLQGAGPAARHASSDRSVLGRLTAQAKVLTVTASVLAAGLVGVLQAAGPAAAATPPLDGSSAAQAAPSCWAIKQLTPSSPDGIYWLQTPQLVAPQQFYCDQTTDGGGWVLVGRGREGWTWSYNGQGSIADLRNVPTGTAAFAPATLPATTVQALLGGGRVDALADGIRVRRAKDIAGSTYQEMRIKASNRANWSWAIGGGELFSSIQVDGTTYGSGNTQSWASGSNQGFLRLTTNEQTNHNYKMGFAYGNTIAGQNNSTSYLWTYTTEKSALAFSQVYLRPKLTTASYPAIPAAGLPASTIRPMMSSETSQTTPWGVTGIIGANSELKMEAETFAQIGNIMYVGGAFQYVQKGLNPAPDEKIAQPWLAGFDVNTGEWLSSFRPTLNGQVWDLQATPDGKLVVGGEFTSVDGDATAVGLAELDPITGAEVPGWTASVGWVSTDGLPAQVRAIDYQDGWLYIGGRFNRVSGGNPLTGPVTVGRAARLRLSDGKPDGAWKPNFDGSIIELDASAQGDRVYFSGYFNNVNGAASANIGIVSTATGAALVPGLGSFRPSAGSGTATYQQAIKEDGNMVWEGGAEHILGQYDRATFSLQSSNITRSGGDIQAIGILNGVVYASCHCGNYNYSGDINYSNPIPTASDVNNIQYIGAWDEQTGQYLPEFYPISLDTRSGIGGWELFPDSNGCLWFGGDFKQGSWTGTGYQWLGGFGKFCARDSQAPTVPGNLALTPSGTGVKLSWTASTDNSGSVRYEVLRGDRVIATTSGVSYIDPAPSYPANYWVRAIDTAGNRSATTAMVTTAGPDTVPPTASITSPANGSTVYGPVTVTADAADDRSVASVDLLVDGAVVASSTTVPASFSWNAIAVGSHTLQAVAHDGAGNTGSSALVTVNVPPDTTAPSAPGTLSQTGTTTSAVSLAWSAATDDRQVAGYQVVRDGSVVGSTSGLTYTDTPLSAGASYTYTVRALDSAGNIGPDSNAVLATTAAANPVLFSETWPGADGTAWPAAWSISGVSATLDTQGGAGRLLVSDVAGGYGRAQLTGLASQADTDLLTSFQWSSNTAASYLSVFVRGSGGWQNAYRPKNGYGIQLQSNSGTVSVLKNVNGTVTTLQNVAGGQQVSTGKQWLRLRVVGSSIQFKVWADGTAEPTSWATTLTDTGVTGSGQLFLSEVRAASNVGDKAITFDDLSVS
ncbi:MAG: fibrinogen-like YCDxxxxGGGW domain-containing protein [Jatrophihabitantaceae bacterium]